MKSILFLVCLMLGSGLCEAQTDSLYIDGIQRDGITRLDGITSCQRQIITAEQIRLSGYTRLGDLLQLVDGATFATTNGEKWLMLSNRTSTFHAQNWILLVNGQRVPFSPADIN